MPAIFRNTAIVAAANVYVATIRALAMARELLPQVRPPHPRRRAVSNSLTNRLEPNSRPGLRSPDNRETFMSAKNAYDFTFRAIDGGALPLSGFRGKALLVVNVASQCGLTPQYEGLEALWKHKRDKGLVVLGVPANDFGAQEPGTEQEIKTFCETRFSVDFPMTAKEHVIGPEAHPLYKWVAAELGED